MEGLTEEMFDETAQFVFKKTLASTVSDLREDEVKIIKAQTVEPTSALSSTFSFFHLLSPKLEVDWEIKVAYLIYMRSSMMIDINLEV